MRAFLYLALLAGVSACTAIRQPAHMVPPSATDWRSVATRTDQARLRGWREAFVDAVKSARAAGFGRQIEAAGPLLDPDSAIVAGAIPGGLYRCRIYKIGAKQAGLLNYIDYPYFTCRIEDQGAVRAFTKLTGSQRVVGAIFPDSAIRQVLLGTLVLGDEQRALPYGADETRNVAGFIEQIGPRRWRLVMPSPHFESQTDVMELVPIGD